MKLLFIGATHEVTGSCTYLEACGKRILIDYGMEQGRDVYENIRVPCAPAEIDYVFLTHAHIDHSGLLPLLYAGGFRGEIHATQATVSLCQIMLRDSAHIQEFEAEWRNRKAKRSGGDIYTPLYTMQEALGSLEHFVPHPYGEKISIADGITIRFLDAGHLLGSSSIEIWLEENGISKKLLFSGDIGNFHQPLIRDPQYADTADYVIMESTYGNRLHEKPKNYIQDFLQILLETFQRGGSVIIPSFAVGRTQELLYFLKQIKDQNLLGKYQDIPIYVDSPLAIEATEIFQRNKESCFDEEALAYVQRGENPIGVSGLRTAVTSEASMAINTDNRSKIVISASGMCEAGRIKHHLKHNLWKPENTILFVMAKLSYPVSLQKIYELCYQDDKLSYFDVSVAVPQMVQSGHLEQLPDETYRITDKGREHEEITCDAIAYPVMQRALTAVQRFNNQMQRKGLIETNVRKEESGDFIAELCLRDDAGILMRLELSAPTLSQARGLTRAYEKQADSIYQQMMTLLLGGSGEKHADV